MEAEFDALVLGIQDVLLLRSLLWMLFSGFDVPVEHTGVRRTLSCAVRLLERHTNEPINRQVGFWFITYIHTTSSLT